MNKFQTIGKPILVASHPRSGTHLTIDLFRKQFQECKSWKKPGETLDRLYFALEAFSTEKPLSEDIALQILSRSKKPLIKTHSTPKFAYLLKEKSDWINWIKETADIYYIIRDPRNVICSLYLFMQSYNHQVRNASLNEFLRQTNDYGSSRVKVWKNNVNSWFNEPGVKILRFEDIIGNPKQIINQIANDINIKPLHLEPLLPQPFKTIWDSRWARFTQRQPESTAILGCYRNQKVQKWQQVFTAADREFFHQEAGDLLIKFGYEESDAWV